MSKERDKFDLEERLIEFAVRVIRTAESLLKTKIGNHISGQLIRSGTSPSPNYGEAQRARSKITSHFDAPIHLAWLRCSLVK
ncbi:MAG: four helix bundle protein [Deltaproteobacteria bacterium]|nr:four helix bundle protein [Deltaproteobacteria bacterium]